MKYIEDNEGNLLEDPAWDIVRKYNIFMKSHVEYILELYKENE